MQLIPKDEHGWTPYAWTIYLAFFFIYPVAAHVGIRVWIATAVGTLIFLALYFRGWWVKGTELAIVTAAITLLGMVYYPFNPGAGCFFIYAAAFAPSIGSARRAWTAIGIIEGIVLVESVALRIHPFSAVWPLVFTGLVGAINMHYEQAHRANARLRLAHDEIEHLAKVAERERIARDLHDLLGHTLSLIVLKSELASKLAERDIDRARSEIRDVERISRDALAQVRAAVGGFRSAGLQAEIDRAREALAAANVTLDASFAALDLTPAHEAVLALAIREGTTNIIRHAAARHCTMRLVRTADGDRLTIEDDGRGSSAAFGNGLSGMRERVEALGGTLTRESAEGTRLTIVLPAAAEPRHIEERSA
jgi:two-component system sensor histidine kinase DesK